MDRDKKAFEEYFLKEHDYLYTFAYIRLRNKEDALEIIQETALYAYKNFNSLRNIEFFKTWITRILINCLYKYYKKEKRYYQNKENIGDQSQLFDSDDLYFLELIAILKEKERNILYLKYYLRYTDKEIAQTLKLPLGTVKTKHSRSLKQLKRHMKKGDLI